MAEFPHAGSGAVDSVNAQTGVVVLDAGDVDADVAGAAASAVAAEATMRAAADTAQTSALTTHQASGDHDSHNDARYDALGAAATEATARGTAVSAEAAARAAADALLIPLTQRGAANGVAALDASGKIASSTLPDLAISTFAGVYATEGALAAASTTTAQLGDWAQVTTDSAGETSTWMRIATAGSTIADWQKLGTPGARVHSVNGQLGTVVLAASDVGAASTSALSSEASTRSAADALLAPLASPALTGTPTAPTPSAADNSTKIATTAYADAALALAVLKSLVTAAGDMIGATGSGVPVRIPIGATDGMVLSVDSGQTSRVRYTSRTVVDTLANIRAVSHSSATKNITYEASDLPGARWVSDGSALKQLSAPDGWCPPIPGKRASTMVAGPFNQVVDVSVGTTNRIKGGRILIPWDGTVSTIWWFVQVTGGNMDLALYDTKATTRALKWAKGSAAVPAQGWRSASPNLAVLAGDQMDGALAADGTTATFLQISGGSSQQAGPIGGWSSYASSIAAETWIWDPGAAPGFASLSAGTGNILESNMSQVGTSPLLILEIT